MRSLLQALCVAALLAPPAAAAGDDKPAPEAACHEDYDECVESCEIEHGMDEAKKKLKKCLKRCREDREECLDRFREGETSKR